MIGNRLSVLVVVSTLMPMTVPRPWVMSMLPILMFVALLVVDHTATDDFQPYAGVVQIPRYHSIVQDIGGEELKKKSARTHFQAKKGGS